MTEELWTVNQVQEFLGLNTTKYADNWLRRQGIRAFIREPGRTGRNLYRAEDVRRAAKPRGDQ